MAWLGAQHTKALKSVAATVNGEISSAVKTRRPVGQLSVYDAAPEGHVTIEDFESFALARLRGEASDPHTMWHILLTTVRDVQRPRVFHSWPLPFPNMYPTLIHPTFIMPKRNREALDGKSQVS